MLRGHLGPWGAFVALTLALPFGSCRRTPEAPVTAEVVTLNNRGVALMGQFDFDAAAAAFDALRTRQPGWPGARLNHAIALVNRQGPEDAADAEAELRPLLDVPEVDRRARYVLALLLAHEGRDEEAWPLLVKVADADPPDGFAAYFAAQQRLTTAPAEALAWYEKAAAREPLLRSAYYGAFLALRRLGRDAEAKDMLARFQDLERNPQARVAEFKYTRMGPLSEVVTIDLAARQAATLPAALASSHRRLYSRTPPHDGSRPVGDDPRPSRTSTAMVASTSSSRMRSRAGLPMASC